MKRRLMSLLLVLVLMATLLPGYSAAADTGKVRVIVENTTARDPEYQGTAVPWRDQLFDIYVDYTEGMSMMRALEEASSVYLGGEDPYAGEEPFLVNPGGYISEINGLGMLGSQGGWMATLNDWFADSGMDSCMVQPGDTIRVMYTMNWGADIGGDWFSTDTGLQRLSFSAGSLYPAFSHDITDYTLYVPADVAQVRISPTAANKNHKVILTSGNEKTARWGARSFPADCGTVTVQVENGMQYHVQIVPWEQIASTSTGCDGGSNCPSIAYQDVDRSETSWYHEAVDWAVADKITNGVNQNSFAPDAACTRAQMVTFLWRASGSPAPASRTNSFVDVPDGQYYTDAVLWANAEGITNGTDKTHFSPYATVTRAQTVTFLWRMEREKQVQARAAFADVDKDAYYADAVVWAAENKITNGVSETSFAPEAACTRAQIVTFLWRDLERVSDPLVAAMAAVAENNGKPACGQSDWAVFDAFRNADVSGTPLPAAYYEYYATVESKAKQTEGNMGAKYATDNARYVLTVTALGYDATDVAGYDLTAPLQDIDYVRKQGVNGVIYTLLALDSANYESYLRADLLQIILDEQLADGGYNYGFGDTADPDLTAMAIQALAPYYGDSTVKAALDKALTCLSALQSEDGGFPNMWGDPACETTAQAVIACAIASGLPGSPYENISEELFTKNNGDSTLMTNLLTYQLKDGSYAHTQEEMTSNGYSTEQALRALVAEECTSYGVTLFVIR